MAWTPAIGSKALVARLGEKTAVELLGTLLSGKVVGSDLVATPFAEVLLDIGNGGADRLLADSSGARLAYWPRVWAARSLAYVGDPTAGPALIRAVEDGHWRVRMTAIQTIGRLRIRGATRQLLGGLEDEHPRVRAAAVLALERAGTDEALETLSRKLLEGTKSRAAIEQAVAEITERDR